MRWGILFWRFTYPIIGSLVRFLLEYEWFL